MLLMPCGNPVINYSIFMNIKTKICIFSTICVGGERFRQWLPHTTFSVHAATAPLLLAQLLQSAVGRVEGEQLGQMWLAEGLAQLHQGGAKVQKESVRGVQLEDLWHLIGPYLGTASVGVQTVAQPRQQQMTRLSRPLEEVLQDLVQLFVKLTHELAHKWRKRVTDLINCYFDCLLSYLLLLLVILILWTISRHLHWFALPLLNHLNTRWYCGDTVKTKSAVLATIYNNIIVKLSK